MLTAPAGGRTPRASAGGRALRALAGCAALLAVLFASGPARAEPGGWPLDAIAAPEAWRVTDGSGVTVALIGSRHPEAVPGLGGKVVRGPEMRYLLRERPGPGDGEPAEPTPGETPGRAADATALAGLIAGSGRAGGVTGVAPGATILSVPVPEPRRADVSEPGETGLWLDDPLARAIRYAADRGASVIYIPVAHHGVGRAEREAVAYALERGAVLVAPAGDDGRSEPARRTGSAYWRFPAGYPGVVGVAAAGRNGAKAPESSGNLSVLVAAPGVDVPVAGGATASGTAVAGAMVAGVAALIKAKYPELTPQMVVRAMTETARSTERYDENVGFGVVNAAAALDKAGQLTAYRGSVPVQDDAHFGDGPPPGPPERPGPDPVWLSIYGIAVLLGVLGLGAATVALRRR